MKNLLPKREQNSNKGTFGKVLNVAGSKYYIGAAMLSSIAALKVGCGYVSLCSEKSVLKSVMAQTCDLVFKNHSEINNIKNYDVVSIGCGLSTGFYAVHVFKKVLKSAISFKKPLIIDADGLNILSEINVRLNENVILTPHLKEASRLLKIDLKDIIGNEVEIVKKLSEKYNCIVALKSHETVVTFKDEIYINKTGNSALAKAGSGDVLCGMITGFVAQKMPLFEAVKLAVYLHGKTGELASEDLSEYSVLASDLLKYIPSAIRNFS